MGKNAAAAAGPRGRRVKRSCNSYKCQACQRRATRGKPSGPRGLGRLKASTSALVRFRQIPTQWARRAGPLRAALKPVDLAKPL
eukprot:1960237-Pyramimonas_sp.AAC.1